MSQRTESSPATIYLLGWIQDLERDMDERIAQTRQQFDLGLEHIRKAIGMRLGGVSASLAAEGISHPAWKGSGHPPGVLPISVAASDAPVLTIEFTSREIQDSWRGIGRADVRRKIGLYANEYERRRRQPGRLAVPADAIAKGCPPTPQ